MTSPWAGHHVGRSFGGPGPLEAADDCTCEKAPCGLIVAGRMSEHCPHHDLGKTIRCGHAPEDCPETSA